MFVAIDDKWNLKQEFCFIYLSAALNKVAYNK